MTHNQPGADYPIPLARLDLYNEAIIMTKFDQNSNTSYPVSIHDVAAAFGTLPTSSGLLPRNTLFHGRSQGSEFVGVWICAAKHVVTVENHSIHIPLPGAVFIGCGKQYYIHAVKEYPSVTRVQLYKYPSPNVFEDGCICAGDTPFPTASVKTIMSAFKLFLMSRFNRHLSNNRCKSYPDNIIELWKTLDGLDSFPLSELILSRANLRAWV